MAMKRRLAGFLAELPGALMLAILTAATTLIMAVLLSAVLGTENAEHRTASRCFAHNTTALLREIVSESETLSRTIDLSLYPPISIDGIDCRAIYDAAPSPPPGRGGD